jgi:hypothetical protein
MPVFCYAAVGAAFVEGDLPHLGLANQYLTQLGQLGFRGWINGWQGIA